MTPTSSSDPLHESVSDESVAAETASAEGLVGGDASAQAVVLADSDAFAERLPALSAASTSTR